MLSNWCTPFTAGVTIGIELPNYTVREEDGPLEVCAVLVEGSLERSVLFTLSNMDDTATSPGDYSTFTVELTFNATSSRACTDIPIEDDTILENPENFTVVLTSDDPDVSFMPPTSVVTIIDNDGVTIGFERETYTAMENEGSVEVCAILRGGELEREVIVNLDTGDITAEGRSFAIIPNIDIKCLYKQLQMTILARVYS